jgi:hypothetical protein
MSRLAKSTDDSDGSLESRNGALFHRFSLAVALLRNVQPLPSPSVHPLSQVLQIGKRFCQTPALHHCQRNYGTAGFLRSLGVTLVHRYCKALPPPSRLPSLSQFSQLLGRTCSRVFLSGTTC